MKWMKLVFAALAFLAVGMSTAQAQHSHRYHGGSRVVFSANLGWPWGFGAYPYYSPYYAPNYARHYGYPVVSAPIVVQSAPQIITYVQQSDVANTPVAATSSPNAYWYYCRNPEGYYPYVKTCQQAWQPVSAQPSAQPAQQ